MSTDDHSPDQRPGVEHLSPATIAVVFGVALALLATWFVGPQRGYWAELQKRPPAEAPSLSWAGLWDTATYAQIEAVAGDALRAKPLAVRAINGTVLWALGASAVPQVSTGAPLTSAVGGDAELYFGGEFTEPCPFLDDGAAAGLANAKAAARAGGKRLLVVVVPSKSTAYLEDSGRWTKALRQCERASQEQLERLAAADDSVRLINPGDVIANDPGLPYWRGDTHWTPAGGMALAQEVMAAVAGPRGRSAVRQRMRHVRDLVIQEDLYTQLGLQRITRTPWWGPVPRDAPAFTALDVPGAWPPTTFRSPRPWPGAPRALVLFDSFVYTPEIQPQVATFFPSGTFLIWDRIADPGRLDPAELVVLETTDRLALGRLAGLQQSGPWGAFLDYLRSPIK
jgi:hypothetical protein